MILATERDRVAHLLRRFGLGASESELDFYGKDGVAGAIDKLLNYEAIDEGFNLPIDAFFQEKKGNLKTQGVQAWWMLRLLTTRRPLQEKMTLFWHDHFATSSQKVLQPTLMFRQNEILRQFAVGSFQELLSNVSKDPAMLFWLDNEFNVKGKPNENFAREVMELFTLGIGNYSEKDVQEAARAFTGWTISGAGKANAQKKGPKGVFAYRENLHDDGQKRILGSEGAFDGDDVLGILCGQTQCSLFITRKLWEWFCYPKPDPETVEKFATIFRKSGLQIKPLLRAIMESSEFHSDRAVRSIYKNPIDFAVAPLRQLGFGEELIENAKPDENGVIPRNQLLPVLSLLQTTKAMGMELLFPPDVSGWDGGQSWISSATMVERIRWADRIFGTAGSGKGSVRLRYPAFGLLQADPTPVGIAEKLLSVFDASFSSAKTAALAGAAKAALNGELTPLNANNAAGAVSRLIFAAPEFQFA